MRAAFYECDITPPLGGHMPGYYRANPAEDVYERLFAKALVMEDGGRYAAIVALDTCEYIDAMTEVVTQRVYEYTGIPYESICIHATHTHKGAPIEDLPHVGQIADSAYRDVCFRLVADAIILAHRRLDTAEAYFGCGHLEGVTFCRNYVRTDGVILTNTVGDGIFSHTLTTPDTRLPVLLIKRGETPIGALFSFACHADATDSDMKGYTSDFPTLASDELKRIYGQGFVSIYLAGASGDVNSRNPDRSIPRPPRFYKTIGKLLAHEVERVVETALPVGETISVCKERIRIERRQATKEYTERMLERWGKSANGMMRIRNLLYYQATNTATHSELTVQVIRIGNTCLYVYPGEIYTDYAKLIGEKTPYKNHFVITNCNSYGGYVPTKEAFSEMSDLYEISLCYDSCLVPEAGEILTNRLLQMGDEAKK